MTTPTAWGEALQQPAYPDPARVAQVLARLQAAAPLVESGQVDALLVDMAKVAAGEAFLLHGGACAESFSDTPRQMRLLMQVVLQAVVVLGYGTGLPIVKILRAAGQLPKPRSSAIQTVGDLTLPSYFGDNVNGVDFSEASRTPDPRRLWRGYQFSQRTWRLIQELAEGRFADLTQVHAWNRAFVNIPIAGRYEQVASEIDQCLGFLNFCGVDVTALPELHQARFFISHEGLLIPYEEALTREVDGERYALSTHFPWIGERTRQLKLAHVAYFASIRNPIGVKLGPGTKPKDVVELCERLNPDHIPGRLTFIIRMGSANVRQKLPPLLRAVRAYERRLKRAGLADKPLVAWVCDPMHGNTFQTADGCYKTRRMEVILDEILGFFEAHQMVGTIPGGLSLEITGEDVTECLGGSWGLGEADLAGGGYRTNCDPRLNRVQVLELAFLIAEMLRNRKKR